MQYNVYTEHGYLVVGLEKKGLNGPKVKNALKRVMGSNNITIEGGETGFKLRLGLPGKENLKDGLIEKTWFDNNHVLKKLRELDQAFVNNKVKPYTKGDIIAATRDSARAYCTLTYGSGPLFSALEPSFSEYWK